MECMMSKLKKALVEYLLRKECLYYMGDDLETEVQEHRPDIVREADELIKIIERVQ
jgi:hypothetical protein